jgi:hypothetical protein
MDHLPLGENDRMGIVETIILTGLAAGIAGCIVIYLQEKGIL